jgi:predicted phosphodiesterase
MKEIFLSDIHWPSHDVPAWNVALKVIQSRQPDIVHIGGDGIDLHSISRHPKQMVEKTILKYELDETRAEIAKLRMAAPTAQMNYQEGNHDSRMRVYLRDRAPELASLPELDYPVLTHLEKHGIKWIGEDEKFKIGKLWHHHGHKIPGGGMFPAKNKFMKVYQNLITGHHHRFDYFSVRQYGTGELFQSLTNATLYRIDPDYAHIPNGHIGFTEINYIPTGEFAATQIHVHPREDGSAFANVDGHIYESHPDEDMHKFLSANAKMIARRSAARKTS